MNNLVAGLRDEIFIRGSVPMTKSEVRAVTLSKLDLRKEDRVADIGAGTGSIALEIARFLEMDVIAIERNLEGVELIKANADKLHIKNIKVVHANAMTVVKQLDINKAFIGGSGGHMVDLINDLSHLERIVVNTITLENQYLAIKALKDHGFDVEIVQILVSRNKNVGSVTMMLAENPIHIITGVKND